MSALLRIPFSFQQWEPSNPTTNPQNANFGDFWGMFNPKRFPQAGWDTGLDIPQHVRPPKTHQIVRTLGCPLGRFGAAIGEYLRSPSGNIWDVPLQRESFKGSVIRNFRHKNSLLLYSNHLTNRRLSQVTHVSMSTFARINP